jgi:SAM-dependent methyltransferase
MGRDLKLKQDQIRFKKISDLCRGKILHLGCSNLKEDYNLHNFIKKRHKEAFSVGLEGSDIIQDLNKDVWKINGEYDTVIAPEIIEHVENPSQFLRNCNKYLKKGGRLIVTTPNASSLIYLKNPNWCVNFNREYKEDNAHIHTFTSGMLKYHLEKIGMKNVKSQYLNGFIRNPVGYFIGSVVPRLRGDILVWGDKA